MDKYQQNLRNRVLDPVGAHFQPCPFTSVTSGAVLSSAPRISIPAGPRCRVRQEKRTGPHPSHLQTKRPGLDSQDGSVGLPPPPSGPQAPGEPDQTVCLPGSFGSPGAFRLLSLPEEGLTRPRPPEALHTGALAAVSGWSHPRDLPGQ